MSASVTPDTITRSRVGIVTSALVPWNSCGAYMSVVLGVPTLAYLPYAVFNYTAPILTLLLGFTGWRIVRLYAAGATVNAGEAAKPKVHTRTSGQD